MRKKKQKKKVIIDAPAAFVRRVLEKAAITWSVLTPATDLRQQHLHVKIASILLSYPDIPKANANVLYIIMGTVLDMKTQCHYPPTTITD
jgi:hypothetical protein